MLKFEKVSLAEFTKAMMDLFPEMTEEDILQAYDKIKLPMRATKGSAGYDFYSPLPFEVKADKTVKIPTGIRAIMDSDKVLCLFPRSGLGFKYRMQLDNTVGIIDSDYSGSDNEGHIFAKISCDSYNKGTVVSINAGDAFMQGVFLNFAVTDDDNSTATRNGGFGSTSK